VESVKAATGKPHLDCTRAESDRRELAPRNDAVLRAGHLGDSGISRTDLQFPFTMNGNGRFAGHRAIVAAESASWGSRT